MPVGPKGQRRPADLIGNAVLIGRIATGEVQDAPPSGKDPAAVERGRKGGLKGGKARAAKMTPAQRKKAAKKAIQARWSRS